MRKLIVLFCFTLVLGSCTGEQKHQIPNVYQYTYDNVSLVFVLDDSDYNRVRQVMISKTESTTDIREDFDWTQEEVLAQLKQHYDEYETLILGIDDANLVHTNRSDYGFSNFITLYLPNWDEVMRFSTDEGDYVFTARLFIDFDEYVDAGCCGFDEIISYLGLEQSVDLQNLYLDRLREDENFIYHEVIDHEHGLALQYFENDLDWAE
jgi:hypothetical protein